MRILAIETATARASVALVGAGGVVGQAVLDEKQGANLARTVASLLGEARVGAFDAIALSIGPGSFTGLRIGLSFVKGLVLAAPRPVLALSTLEVIAASTTAPGPVLAALDARNGEVFARLAGTLEDGLYRIDAVAARLAGLPPGSIAGEPPAALSAALPAWTVAPAREVPLAVVLAELARSRLDAGEGQDPVDLQPSYGQPAAVDRRRLAVDTPASQS